MICRLCLKEGVLSEALGKPFYYCRNCKIEITEGPSEEYGSDPFDDSGWPPGFTPIIYTTASVRFHKGGTVQKRTGIKYCKGSGKIDSECDCLGCRTRYS